MERNGITNEYYYSLDYFNVVDDMQITELNDRFNEVNSEVFICMDFLNLRDSFGDFE